MITCPFCQKPVHLSNDERDSNSLVETEATNDFYCPTYVDISPGIRYSHYQRIVISKYIEYRAYIPPFGISYFEDEYIAVFSLKWDNNTGNLPGHVIYEETTNPTFDKFVKLYHRFSNLKVFL